MAEIKATQLEAIFLQHGAVEFFLEEDKSRSLGKMLRAWHRLLRHKRFSRPLRWLVLCFDGFVWLWTTRRQASDDNSITEIFVFYVKYQGPRNIGIEWEPWEIKGVPGRKINRYRRQGRGP